MPDLMVPVTAQGSEPVPVPDLNWVGALNVPFGATSAQSAAINARAVLVSADQNCWITMGPNPLAAKAAGSIYLSSGAPQLLPIQPGWSIAAIQATAGGNLSIVPCIWPDALYPTPTFDWDFTTGALPPGWAYACVSTAWYFNSAGLLVSAAPGVPRFDYDPITLQPRGVMIEITASNVCLWSRDFTNAVWVKTNATAAKTQTGIDGAANSASSITASAANATVLQSFTIGSGPRVISGYVKRLVGSGPISVTLDGGATWTAITVTSGWTRFVNIVQTLANPQIGFQLAASGDSIAVDCMQMEQQQYTTSPILTAGSAVNRQACSISQASPPWFNPNAGTIWGLFDIGTIPSGINRPLFTVDDGTTTNRYLLRIITNPDSVVAVAGSVTWAGGGSAVAGNVFKNAIAYQVNAPMVQATAGVLNYGGGSAPTAQPIGINRAISTSSPQWVRRLTYWPQRLSDAALMAVTT